jgi:hypothetical protein
MSLRSLGGYALARAIFLSPPCLYAFFCRDLAAVMRPWLAEYMKAWDLSTLVKAAENDLAASILPAENSQPRKCQLLIV